MSLQSFQINMFSNHIWKSNANIPLLCNKTMNKYRRLLRTHLHLDLELRADIFNNSPGTGPKSQKTYCTNQSNNTWWTPRKKTKLEKNLTLLTLEQQIAPDHLILRLLHMHPQISPQSLEVVHLKDSLLFSDHLTLTFLQNNPKPI